MRTGNRVKYVMVSGTRRLVPVSGTRNRTGNRHQKMVSVSSTLQQLFFKIQVAQAFSGPSCTLSVMRSGFS